MTGDDLRDMDFFIALALLRRLGSVIVAMVGGAGLLGMRPGLEKHLRAQHGQVRAGVDLLVQHVGVPLPGVYAVLDRVGRGRRGVPDRAHCVLFQGTVGRARESLVGVSWPAGPTGPAGAAPGDHGPHSSLEQRVVSRRRDGPYPAWGSVRRRNSAMSPWMTSTALCQNPGCVRSTSRWREARSSTVMRAVSRSRST